MRCSSGFRAIAFGLIALNALVSFTPSASAKDLKAPSAKGVASEKKSVATNSISTRIQRPSAGAISKPELSISGRSENRIERPAKHGCCAGSDDRSESAEEEADEAVPNFSYDLASPQEHFDMWLKMSLYPALCHTVLCRRQCALNGYESCNALGVKRSILNDAAVSNGGSCGSGGCGSDR